MAETKNLPTLADLHEGDIQVAFKHDQYNLLLSQPPPAKFLKKHPIYGNQYLPVDKVEFLATRIFQRWRWEIKWTKQLLNSIEVAGRYHYFHPVSQTWEWIDGGAAYPIQLDSGATASDITKIKGNGVQLAYGIADSLAFKAAVEKLGKIFGRDLNRKDTIEFQGAYSTQDTQKKEANEPSRQHQADNEFLNNL